MMSLAVPFAMRATMAQRDAKDPMITGQGPPPVFDVQPHDAVPDSLRRYTEYLAIVASAALRTAV